MIRAIGLLALAALWAQGTGANAQDAKPLAAAAMPDAPHSNDWTTWGYDQERTGWNRGETTLSKANVAALDLRWNVKLPVPVKDTTLSTVTAPLIAAGVQTSRGRKNLLFVLGSDDVMYALDADSGQIVWTKAFQNRIQPRKGATWLCSNTANATPVIDRTRGVIFFMASDGLLRGIKLSDGTQWLTPTEMVAPFTRAWSLNLVDDIVYTTSGRACGEVQDRRSPMATAVALAAAGAPVGPNGPENVMTDPSAISAMDISTPTRPELTRFYTSGGRPAGAWGRGGLARGPGNSLIFETSDGVFDPGAGSWGDTIMRLSAKATRVIDSYTPDNHAYIQSRDLAGSASPVVFPFEGKTLIAVGQKEGVLYILDAANMGGGIKENHATPLYKSTQLGNDAALGTDPGQGVWGAITTYMTSDGRRFLYVPMYGPASTKAPVFKHSGGDAPNGSIMAFQVVSEGGKIDLIPQWTSPDMIMPDPPVVANGVVYAISTGGQAIQNPRNPDGTRVPTASAESARARSTPVGQIILRAFDAETGNQLYSSGNKIPSWVHFSEPVVALGKVYLVNHDAQVMALGLR